MLRISTTSRVCTLLLVLCSCSGENNRSGTGDIPPAGHDVAGEAVSGDAAAGDLSPADGDVPSVDPAVVWSDPVARLQWQRVAADDRMALDVATVYCEQNQAALPGLGWHVPSIDELRSLVSGCPGTETGGACGVTAECLNLADCWSADCWKCAIGEGPADGCYRDAHLQGDCGATWSSDMVGDQGGRAWFVNFQKGGVHHDLVTNQSIVRCVRWY